MKTISAAELKEKAKQLRKTAVTMIYEAAVRTSGRIFIYRRYRGRPLLQRDECGSEEPTLGGS